jgi:1-acyl-sn-glycerol-3-phosphate acyltransferase
LVRFLAWTFALIPVQLVLLAVKSPAAKRLPMIYHAGVCRIIGFDVVVKGEQSRAASVLFVSNHSSYLDITVLGSVLAGSFVAKSEVANWPFFGFLAKLQRTVFVDRRVSQTADGRDAMTVRLETGDRLVLFPEGTSNDGNRVLPFKSAYFGLAERPLADKPLVVQPVSVAYTRLDHMPMGRRYRPEFAWYGDMELPGHLWNVFGIGRTTIEVRFHELVTIERFHSRKDMALYCHDIVAAGVARSLVGEPWRGVRKRKTRFRRLRAAAAAVSR